MDNIHCEVYSLLIETLLRESSEKARILSSVDITRVVQGKRAWATKWLNRDNASFAERLVALAAAKGILLSGFFCAISWLERKGSGILPGLCHANALITRDERLHTVHHGRQSPV
jgi:ribonucleotide reductase beta subunit family protein with ferritin-like domain